MKKSLFKRFGWAIYISIGLAALVFFLFATYRLQESTTRDLIVNLSSELFAIALIFFVIQQFFLWNPDDELKEEYKALLKDFERTLETELARRLASSRASTYRNRDKTYAAVDRTFTDVSSNEPSEKQLMLAALHGHSGKRRTNFSHSNPFFESFIRHMENAERSSGPGRWSVRELYNITDEDRLNMIVERMRKIEDAEGYEVRAFCMENVLPQLTPLIIGKENIYIAMDDQTYYGARSAIHIHGHEAVLWATDYFESLWSDKRTFILRSGFGIDENQINAIREAIRNLQK